MSLRCSIAFSPSVTQAANIFAYGSNMHLGDLRRWLAEKRVDVTGSAR